MSFNLYSYVRGNPVMGTDPSGADIRMIYREPHLDAGHIIVQVVDHESGKVEATWSFGPKSTLAALFHLPVASHQTKDVNAYLSDKKYQSATLKTDKKTDAKTVNLINNRKKKNEKYDLDTNNCATTATEIVESATGMEVSNSMYPKKVFQDFQKVTNPPQTVPTTPKPKQPATTNPNPTTLPPLPTLPDAPSSTRHQYQ
ncbi:MAG: hypothetical protein GXO69_03320 [Acidobacteria bacterium]|nr:hypothetical protein [Acidobacteriota bacterium]